MKTIGLLMGFAASMLVACGPTPASETEQAATTAETEAESQPETGAAPALMSWDDLFSREMPQPTQTIRTGEGETDLVDVWLPDGEPPFNTVIMVHGGCWQKEIADRTIMNYAAEALRKAGMAVWNIEYRGVDEEGGGYPGTYLDVARGVDALRDHAGDLGLKTEGVAAFGHSAGGHLVLWAAGRHNLPPGSPLYMDNPLPIAGVLNSGGLADLRDAADVTQAGCLADILDQLVGEPTEERPNVYRDTSPDELLPIGARQISVNGSEDAIAPPRLGKAYTELAKGKGDDATQTTIDGAGHVELIAPGSSAFSFELFALRSLFNAYYIEDDGKQADEE